MDVNGISLYDIDMGYMQAISYHQVDRPPS